MKLIVNPHKIEIEKTPVNEKEINITECEFEFSEEITQDFVKDVYFTLGNTTIKMANIQNNKCDIPNEVLTKKGTIEIGVVAYLVENEEEIKRYNPSPAYFNSWVGSLKSNAQNTEPVTPSDKEQMEQALNDMETKIDNLDIDAEKVGTTATIIVTKKDGTQETILIEDGEDGADFQYNWSGTSLGVKTSEEQDYQYVNLKGDTGEPGQIEFVIVSELPQTGVEGTIYLVPLEEPDMQENNYAEYIWVNDDWELLGKIGVHIDLSNYYTKTETNSLLDDKIGFTDYASTNTAGAIKVKSSNGTNITDSGYLISFTRDYAVYQADPNSILIGKGTLENVITGKNLETANNKVTSISSNSTDTEYPSAKCVYDSQEEQNTIIENQANEIEYLNSVIEQAFDEITDEDTEITLNNTIQAKMKMELKGNTEQTTYTGKNLCPTTFHGSAGSITFTKVYDENGDVAYIDVDGTASSTSYIDIGVKTYLAGTYIITGSPSGGSDNSYQQRMVSGQSALGIDNGSGATFTLNSDAECFLRIRIASGYTANHLKFYPMVRLSSVTDDTYEPYVGGTPSPNPDYPQDVRVVTGDNTIHISNSDNTISQEHLLSLGSIELCKIGTYQDYIYKNNGKWYLHKEIGKIVLDGSNYPLYGDGGSSNDYWEYSRTGMIGGIGSQISVITNYLNQTTNSRIVILSNGGMYFRFPKNVGIDVSTNTLLNAWLSTHNTIVYYVLATPTNTEITDTTLIRQLNNLEKTMSYKTQTNISQTNANLPFILYANALGKNQ